MKNKLKYESYQVAMRLLENAKRHKDMPMCIAAVAFAEEKDALEDEQHVLNLSDPSPQKIIFRVANSVSKEFASNTRACAGFSSTKLSSYNA